MSLAATIPAPSRRGATSNERERDTPARAECASSPRPPLRAVPNDAVVPAEESFRDTGTLKSVGTALDLISCFAYDTELGVSDIARRLGIAKSTAHRLLLTLRSRGLVEHDPETRLYRLGLRLSEFGNLARDRHPVRHVVLPHLVELRRASGLPVRVGAPDGGDIVHVDHLSSSAAPARLEQMPWRLPLHLSAAGLAVSAFNPEVAAVRRELGFEPGDTISDVISDAASFDAALAVVRDTGTAVQRDSAVLGITALAAPIRDDAGIAYMAIGVTMPTEDVRRIDHLSRLVVVAANRIARSASPVIADRGSELLPTLLGHTRPSS